MKKLILIFILISCCLLSACNKQSNTNNNINNNIDNNIDNNKDNNNDKNTSNNISSAMPEYFFYNVTYDVVRFRIKEFYENKYYLNEELDESLTLVSVDLLDNYNSYFNFVSEDILENPSAYKQVTFIIPNDYVELFKMYDEFIVKLDTLFYDIYYLGLECGKYQPLVTQSLMIKPNLGTILPVENDKIVLDIYENPESDFYFDYETDYHGFINQNRILKEGEKKLGNLSSVDEFLIWIKLIIEHKNNRHCFETN